MADDIFAGAIKLLLGDESEEVSLGDPDEDFVSVGTMTDFPARCFIAYGESVLRFDQVSTSTHSREEQVFKRRVYSPELDLATALALLGDHTEFFTVLPPGPLGDLVSAECIEASISIKAALADEGNHMGDMTLTRSQNGEYQQIVHQRRYSAFHNTTNHFKWDKGILSDRAPCWVHTSLSSFVWTENGLGNWVRLVEAVFDPKRATEDVLMSLEIKLHECDAPFSAIWKFAMPFARKMSMLILTAEECLLIASSLGVATDYLRGKSSSYTDLQPWANLVDSLRLKIECKSIVVPFVHHSESVRFVVSHEIGLTLVSPTAFSSAQTHLAKLVHGLMHMGSLEDKERFQTLINDLNWSISGPTSEFGSPRSPERKVRRSIVKRVIEEMSE